MSASSVGHAPRGADKQRYLSVALVVSLHVAVIYVLLTAFEIIPNPFRPTPPVITRIIQQTEHRDTFPQFPDNHRFIRPVVPEPDQPVIDIAKDNGGPNPGNGNQIYGPTFPTGPTIGVRAIADTHTIPPYPTLGMRLGHEGIVQLRIVVDEQGRVVAAQVESSSGYTELDDAAVAWVQSRWRYQPAMQDGRAVSATLHVAVKFHLNTARG